MTTRLSPGIDVMKMELWSLPMAAAWMIWRTEDAVRGAYPAANGYTTSPDLMDIFKEASDPDSNPIKGGPAAQIDFWSVMLAGRLHPAGVLDGRSVRVPIPCEEWRDLTYLGLQARHPEAIGTLTETRYKDVVVPRIEVMEVWAAKSGAQADHPEQTTSSLEHRASSPAGGAELRPKQTALRQTILDIDAELWPDGRRPPNVTQRNDAIKKRAGAPPYDLKGISDRTIQRAFAARTGSDK